MIAMVISSTLRDRAKETRESAKNRNPRIEVDRPAEVEIVENGVNALSEGYRGLFPGLVSSSKLAVAASGGGSGDSSGEPFFA